MMDKEEYKREVVRMWDSVRECSKRRDKCHGVDCKECPIHGFKYGCSSPLSAFEIYNAVEKWSKEHPPKKYKISQLEYDILKFNYYNNANSRFFYEDKFFMALLKEGYFKGADERDVVNCYFLDCEVEDD